MTNNTSWFWQPAQQPPQRSTTYFPVPDIAIAVSLFIFISLSSAYSVDNGSTAVVWYTCCALLCLPQLWRTRNPHLMLALSTLGALILVAVFDQPTIATLAIPVCVYAYARHVDEPTARIVLVIGIVGALLATARWFELSQYVVSDSVQSDYLQSNTYIFLTAGSLCVAGVLIPYLIGRMVRERVGRANERVADAHQQALYVSQWHAEQARVAQMQARSEIARELHDIVAHSLSVMIVQADGGRAAARAGDSEAATDALGTIGDTGRDALTEMRRIVGVLRGEQSTSAKGDSDYAPNPGLADINALVARTGERVTLKVIGTVPTNPPPAVALTAYRIVQEGLTNFMKHTGPLASALVSLEYTDTQLNVTVTDDGIGATSGGELGYGLRGMSERVAAVGGHFSAGPNTAGGFLVQAQLPLHASGPLQTEFTQPPNW